MELEELDTEQEELALQQLTDLLFLFQSPTSFTSSKTQKNNSLPFLLSLYTKSKNTRKSKHFEHALLTPKTKLKQKPQQYPVEKNL